MVELKKQNYRKNKELYNRFIYNVKGVRLQQIDNFLSCVSQYYIEDINA